MIGIIPYASQKVICNVKEALRYMGYSNKNLKAADDTFMSSVYECKDELENILNPKACYSEVEINVKDACVTGEFGCFKSKALAKNLKGCTKAVLFCATVGIQTDLIIKKYSVTSPSKSVICDALASSAVEVWCDAVEGEVSCGRGTRPRFSAGYGDFDISYQKVISQFLNTSKNCGVTVTNSMMMIPTKSVTAIAGIDDNLKCKSYNNKCLLCTNTLCEYRND